MTTPRTVTAIAVLLIGMATGSLLLPTAAPVHAPNTGVAIPPGAVLTEGQSATHYFDTDTEHPLISMPAPFTYRAYLSFTPADAIVRFQAAGEATVASGGEASIDFHGPGSEVATWLTVDVLDADQPVAYHVWVNDIPSSATQEPTQTVRPGMGTPPTVARSTPSEVSGPSPTMTPTLSEARSWITHAHTGHTDLSATACKAGGVLELDLEIPHHPRAVTNQAHGDCMAVSQVLDVQAPGKVPLTSSAIDRYAATAVMDHMVDLIPYTPTSVEGYPPLGEIPLREVGTLVSIDTLVTTEGEVRGYRVAMDGQIVMSNLGEIVPESGDSFSHVTFDRAGSADYWSEDGVAWSGLVHQTDETWWHIQPLTAS